MDGPRRDEVRGHTWGFVGDGGYRHTSLSGMTYRCEGTQQRSSDPSVPTCATFAEQNTWKPSRFGHVFTERAGHLVVIGIYHPKMTQDESIQPFNGELPRQLRPVLLEARGMNGKMRCNGLLAGSRVALED